MPTLKTQKTHCVLMISLFERRLRADNAGTPICPEHCVALQCLFLCGTHCKLLRNGVQLVTGHPTFQFNKYYEQLRQPNSTVYSWEAHVETVPPCYSRTLEELTQGKWYLSNSGHHRYAPDTCALQGLEAYREYRTLHLSFPAMCSDHMTGILGHNNF